MEDAQHQVNVSKPVRNSRDELDSKSIYMAPCEVDAKKYTADYQTAYRADDGHTEFILRLLRFTGNLRNTTKNEERYRLDWYTLPLENYAMHQFVNQDGAKEQDTGYQAGGYSGRQAPGRVGRWEVDRKSVV